MERQAWRKDDVKGHREKTAVYKTKVRDLEQFLPS